MSEAILQIIIQASAADSVVSDLPSLIKGSIFARNLIFSVVNVTFSVEPAPQQSSAECSIIWTGL